MKKLFLTLITAISCLALNAETWTVGGVSYTVSRNSTSYLGTSYHTKLEKFLLLDQTVTSCAYSRPTQT